MTDKVANWNRPSADVIPPKGTDGRAVVMVAILVMVTLLKLSLVGSGLFTFEDEGRYTDSARALGFLGKGDLAAAMEEVFSTQGRPGDTLLRMLPNGLQFLTGKLSGRHIYDPANTYPLFVFNFATFLLILWVLYRYSLLVLGGRPAAVLVVIVYSSMVNPQIYLRHALPYDMALLVLLFVLERLTRRVEWNLWDPAPFFGLGAAGFFGFTIYPGYFPLFMVTGSVLVLGNLELGSLGLRARCVTAYAFGGVLCFAVFEGMSRIGGRSYLHELSVLSGQIKGGAFDESFTFAIKYLVEVENVSGVALMVAWVGFVGIFVRVVSGGGWALHRRILFPLGLVAVVFLSYAASGYFWHKMVFYGRLLHQYFPFLCVGFVYVLRELWLLRRGNAPLVPGVLSLVCAAQLVFNLVMLHRIRYPGDIGWSLAKAYCHAEVIDICEYSDGYSHVPSARIFVPPLRADAPLRPRVVLVNGCVYHPVAGLGEYLPFVPGADDVLMTSQPHFLNHPAYLFEGYLPEERRFIQRTNPRIKVYSRAGEEKPSQAPGSSIPLRLPR